MCEGTGPFMAAIPGAWAAFLTAPVFAMTRFVLFSPATSCL